MARQDEYMAASAMLQHHLESGNFREAILVASGNRALRGQFDTHPDAKERAAAYDYIIKSLSQLDFNTTTIDVNHKQDHVLQINNTKELIFYISSAAMNYDEIADISYMFNGSGDDDEFQELRIIFKRDREGKAIVNVHFMVLDLDAEDPGIITQILFDSCDSSKIWNYRVNERDISLDFEELRKKFLTIVKKPPVVGGGFYKYKGRSYKVRVGSRGGKYILVKGKKLYIHRQ